MPIKASEPNPPARHSGPANHPLKAPGALIFRGPRLSSPFARAPLLWFCLNCDTGVSSSHQTSHPRVPADQLSGLDCRPLADVFEVFVISFIHRILAIIRIFVHDIYCWCSSEMLRGCWRLGGANEHNDSPRVSLARSKRMRDVLPTNPGAEMNTAMRPPTGHLAIAILKHGNETLAPGNSTSRTAGTSFHPHPVL